MRNFQDTFETRQQSFTLTALIFADVNFCGTTFCDWDLKKVLFCRIRFCESLMIDKNCRTNFCD